MALETNLPHPMGGVLQPCLLSGLNRGKGRKWCNHSLYLSQVVDWIVCAPGCLSVVLDIMVL